MMLLPQALVPCFRVLQSSALARARLALLGLALSCGVRAQEPVNPEQPPAEKRAAVTAVDPRRAPPGPLNLDATAIRGNQELPKVLYIVPWKDPAMAELAGRPVNSLVEEVLAPVDREVFRRQTRYFGQLYGVGSAE
ncbi:MAG: hypothetical protein JNK40_04310 [Chromatiales bacterium]|nr:hypothetical protein [Chromatiales bacterium]